MISLILLPFARVLALTDPLPLSASHPSAFDLANISSHHGNKRSRTMSMNQGVKELAKRSAGSSSNDGWRSRQLTLCSKHFFQFLSRDVFRITDFVVVELGIDVQGCEQDIIDYLVSPALAL